MKRNLEVERGNERVGEQADSPERVVGLFIDDFHWSLGNRVLEAVW